MAVAVAAFVPEEQLTI